MLAACILAYFLTKPAEADVSLFQDFLISGVVTNA